MKIISLQELQYLDFSVTKVIPLFQYWKEEDSFNALTAPKNNHSLLFFAGCDGHYTFADGTTFTAQRGDVVYIPAGACYKTTFINKQDHLSTILINFQLQAAEGPFAFASKVSLMAKDPDKVFRKLFYQTAEDFASAKMSTIALCADLYQILNELQRYADPDLKLSASYTKIAKGISYLERDSQQLLSIDEIADMCQVSPNTFRRLFAAYAGVSPVEFRLRQKIARAKQLLESEIFTVAEISDVLGFSDVSYFSRIFKKKTGLSPTDYLNIHKE